MFSGCRSLLNMEGLENLDVSKGNNLENMFSDYGYNCFNIKVLENWNVSNGNNFSNMFSDCSELCNIKGLENWNVSNGKIFLICSLIVNH